MKSFQQLSQEIIDIIKATNNYFIGNTSGMNNDGTVNVHHPKGYSVNAIAANPISSGEVIVFNVNNTWYAFGEQRTVVKEDVLIQRKSRAKKIEVYPVKTLYVIYNNQIELSVIYLGGNETSREIYRADYYFGDHAYWRALVKNIEGYLSYDGKDTISQIELGNWFEYHIKINRQEIAFIERWYPRWIHTFNLGMGTLEYTDDLLLSEDGKRIIKKDEEIQIGINLEKYVYITPLNTDGNAELEGKYSFGVTYVKGSIETPRKDGTINICTLDTEYEITFDEPFAKVERNEGGSRDSIKYFNESVWVTRYNYLRRKIFVDIVENGEQYSTAYWLNAEKTLYYHDVDLPFAERVGVETEPNSNIWDLSEPWAYEEEKINKKTQFVRYTVEGIATVLNTTDGEIYQDYKGYLDCWNNSEQNFDEYYQVKFRIDNYRVQTLKEERNIIKLKHNDTTTILNTGNFGVIYLNKDNNNISITEITSSTEEFTINVSANILKYSKFFNILDVQNISDVTTRQIDPLEFKGNFLMGYEINNKEYLIKGEIIENPTYNDNDGLIIICKINSKKQTVTSFKNYLIMDNGSFYNYWFRKNIPLKYLGRNSLNENMPWTSGGSAGVENLVACTSMLPTIPLNGTFHGLFFSSNSIEDIQYDYLENLAFTATINNRTDNIKGNKIYSVVKAEGSKAWIEQWNIFDNGDVKYNKVFQVDYVPLKKPKTDEGEAIAILAHSYYPK